MKKLKLAISILILIPILIFSSHYYLRHATTSMSQILSKSETLVEQGKKKEAAKQVASFQSEWNKNKAIMSVFIRHDELDTVNLSAAKLEPYLDDNSTSDFCAESETLKFQLHHIWETEKFSIDNVL
jgi:hypothetical protein